MASFADVIIDITHADVDRAFQYRIPDELVGEVQVGSAVEIPFGRGNTGRTGYVVSLSGTPELEPDRIKDISGVSRGQVQVEGQMLRLAWWLKENYGCAMNQALKTVLPVREKVRGAKTVYLECPLDDGCLRGEVEAARRKKHTAKVKVLEYFLARRGGGETGTEAGAVAAGIAGEAPDAAPPLHLAGRTSGVSDMPSEAPGAASYRHGDAPQDMPQGVPQDMPRGVPQDMPRGAPQRESGVGRQPDVTLSRLVSALQVSAAAVNAMVGKGLLAAHEEKRYRNPLEWAGALYGIAGGLRCGEFAGGETGTMDAPSGHEPAKPPGDGVPPEPGTMDASAERGAGAVAAGSANGGHGDTPATGRIELNAEQRSIVDDICAHFDAGGRETSLIHGITGSGKTQVYIELIHHMRKLGKDVIMLIPEIALTFQTVSRFVRNFGDEVSIINSKLSKGERFDQFERARNGEVHIMVGPRSALFTPFPELGMVIIDEEHEGSYKSDQAPRYHARETALERARLAGGCVVLGSATPSVESYHAAMEGRYRLYELTKRAVADSELADVAVVDLRAELRAGNKSVFSRLLREKIEDRLEKGEQAMLFLNRRGFARFVSCRSCGLPIKCPHCDVSLTLHDDGTLRCHYCEYHMRSPSVCPSCGSPYIAHFGVGTQKLERFAARFFPQARILRMDKDTTSDKHGHERILSAFARHEADILIGTQMIVKGHDFPDVTLVGIIAADMSLHESDFRSAEQTFQLLTQAAGRAGRAGKLGDVIIQTYQPGHYAISAAASQDYAGFYRKEIAFRNLLQFPPAAHLLTAAFSCGDEQALDAFLGGLLSAHKAAWERMGARVAGPAQHAIYKVNDIYRKNLFIKHTDRSVLIGIKDQAEAWQQAQRAARHAPKASLPIWAVFDFA
ncbi:MAG: primosomal protein N' [Lachnospiraceae bacterium]|jgi:primosomal protein N' (replication factor Y)|nr:primosomal protein N' [Lachnospiraceae bacterium]